MLFFASGGGQEHASTATPLRARRTVMSPRQSNKKIAQSCQTDNRANAESAGGLVCPMMLLERAHVNISEFSYLTFFRLVS